MKSCRNEKGYENSNVERRLVSILMKMIVIIMIMTGSLCLDGNDSTVLGVSARKLNPRRHLEAPSTSTNVCTHSPEYNDDANVVAYCKTLSTKEEC